MPVRPCGLGDSASSSRMSSARSSCELPAALLDHCSIAEVHLEQRSTVNTEAWIPGLGGRGPRCRLPGAGAAAAAPARGPAVGADLPDDVAAGDPGHAAAAVGG